MTADVPLDPAGLARLLEITGGDQAFVDELVDTFIDDAGAQLADLDAAVAAGDTEGLVRPAHSLKSSADNVGAVTLRDLARQLEADARTGTVPEPGVRVAALRTAFEAAREALVAARAHR